MTTLQTINAAANWNLRVNENFKAVSPAASFGIKDSTTTGLTLGYYGGILNAVSYADGTHLLTASTTRYVVASKATGVVSSATGTTNWDDTTNYKRMGVAVVGASTITSWTDWREFSSNASGAGTGDVVGPASSVGGRVATFNGTSGKLIQDGGTLLSDLATLSYVDNLVQGLSWKKAVRAATTTAGTLASSFENGDSIDGVTLATNDRILIKNQSTASENGIYTVNASGAPTRATDADTGAEMVNATVFVSEGTTLAETQWTCSTNAPITIGSTSLAFVQLTAGGGAAWGAITGTLSSQADLQAALDAKAQDRRTVTALATSGSVGIDVSLGDYFTLALAGNVSGFTFSNLPGSGKGVSLMIRITQDATARTVAWPSSFRWEGTAPVVSTGSGAIDLLALTSFDNGTKWDATLSKARV
jgi:hypothetical protein